MRVIPLAVMIWRWTGEPNTRDTKQLLLIFFVLFPCACANLFPRAHALILRRNGLLAVLVAAKRISSILSRFIHSPDPEPGPTKCQLRSVSCKVLHVVKLALQFHDRCMCADSSVYFDHTHLKTPSSKDDVIEIVKEAVDGGRKVRVVGSGHSWSSVAMSDDIIVSLWNYTGIVSGSRVQCSLCFYPKLYWNPSTEILPCRTLAPLNTVLIGTLY